MKEDRYSRTRLPLKDLSILQPIMLLPQKSSQSLESLQWLRKFLMPNSKWKSCLRINNRCSKMTCQLMNNISNK